MMTTEEGATRQLADFVVKADYRDLSAEVVTMAKRCILDNIGCQLYGRTTEAGRITAAVMKKLEGVPEATIIGERKKVPAVNAAHANGAMAYNLYNDKHSEGVVHPGSIVVPVVLAVGEREHKSGADVIL